MKDQENLGTYPVKTDGDDGATINTVFSALVNTTQTTFDPLTYEGKDYNFIFDALKVYTQFVMQLQNSEGQTIHVTYKYDDDSGLWNQDGDPNYPVYNDQVYNSNNVNFI
ncbi:hypothetical protein [Flavobacterium lipolyticum]|uniref:Uncharacterized protein n=1 Tax=Flavobacterium lipolyticum TaxID=2893754 RepID=A0ABS8M6I9_9FLAO|nr:hypothetical protein [Flavobacterium sp. F-126]MCC9020381.1 hypothetical protein [Flavobacterium sp. F-126]